MKLFEWLDIEGSKYRWCEFIPKKWYEYEVLSDESSGDYQGSVDLILARSYHHKLEDKTVYDSYVYISYSYGSCSGCDGFEDLTDEEMHREMESLSLELSSYDWDHFLERATALKERLEK